MDGGASQSPSPIEPEESAFVAQLVAKWSRYGEECLFTDVVREPADRRGKPDPECVFAVGRYRCWLTTRGKKPKLAREFPIYDVDSIVATHEVTLNMKVSCKEKPVRLITIRESGIVRAVHTSFNAISFGFPEDYLRIECIGFPAPAVPAMKEDAAEGFMDNYHAWCAYYSVPPVREIEFFVKSLFTAGVNELDLTCCPAIDPEPDRTTQLDFTPVLAALRYDESFRGLTVADSHGAMSMLAQVMQTNAFLTRIVASGVGAGEQQVVELCEALRRNEDHAVQVLDISHNSGCIQQRSAPEIYKAIVTHKHALLELNLSYCAMPAKAVQMVLQALNDNPKMSLGLQHLNLSGNRVELLGSQELDKWFSTLKAYSKLKYLFLRDTNVVLPALTHLKNLQEIAELDLAENKLDRPAVDLLASFLELTPSLRKLDVSDTGLTYEGGLGKLFSSLRANQKSLSVKLVLKGNPELRNELSSKDLAALAPRISSLDLTGLRFREALWVDVINAAAKMEGLTEVVLRNTLARPSTFRPCIQALVALAQNPSVTTIDISEGTGRTIVVPFLESLRGNTSLKNLNIADNGLGDFGAAAIADLLISNKTLACLEADNNQIKTQGLLIIAAAFSVNKTLLKLEVWDDISRLFVGSSGSTRARLVSTVDNLQRCLQRNSNAAIEYWQPSAQRLAECNTKTPQDVSGFGTIPAFLQEKAFITMQDVPNLLRRNSIPVAEPPAAPQESSACAAAPPQRTSLSPTLQPPKLSLPPTLTVASDLSPKAPVSPPRPVLAAPPPLAAPAAAVAVSPRSGCEEAPSDLAMMMPPPRNPAPKPPGPAPRPPGMLAGPAAAKPAPPQATPAEAGAAPAAGATTAAQPQQPQQQPQEEKPKSPRAANSPAGDLDGDTSSGTPSPRTHKHKHEHGEHKRSGSRAHKKHDSDKSKEQEVQPAQQAAPVNLAKSAEGSS
eukprot:m51a1_g9300 hypothetical protein (953) ;mRNA; f:60291-64128